MILQYGNEKENNMTYAEAEEINVCKLNIMEVIDDFYKRNPVPVSETNRETKLLAQSIKLNESINNYIKSKTHCGDEIIYHITTPFNEMQSINVVTLLTKSTSPKTYIFDWSGKSNMSVYLLNNNGKTIQRIN